MRTIRELQRAWAAKRSIAYDLNDRTQTVDENLFQPLHPETRTEFTDGKGAEFGLDGSPGKMHSLISSSALACNVFDPWRHLPMLELAAALEIDTTYRIARFEATHPTGFGGTHPHLDVELTSNGHRVVAVESKFSEPYGSVSNKFQPSYFMKPTPWEDLQRSLETARAIADDGLKFRYLHAAQLIKHALGLTRSHGREGFELIYLWYRVPGPEGDANAEEFRQLQAILGDEFSLRAITYHELVGRLTTGPEGWLEYIRSRYALPATPR